MISSDAAILSSAGFEIIRTENSNSTATVNLSECCVRGG